MVRGFIEIDAGVAMAILIAILTAMASLFLHSTWELREKTTTFGQMEEIIEGEGQGCIPAVVLKENELVRNCNDTFP